MKQKVRMIIRVMVICFFTFFLSCQNDELDVKVNPGVVSSTYVSVDELLSLIHDPIIRNSLSRTFITKTKQGEEYKAFEMYFEKVAMTDYDSYSLLISDYSSARPYYLFFIVTIDNKNVEKAAYVKYIPITKSRTGFSIDKFTGDMEVSDLENNIIAVGQFNQGISIGVVVTPQCKTTTFVSEVTCSHGGGHGVGESCNSPFVNDAYFQISVITNCIGSYTITFILGGSGNGNGSGSGGISYNQAFLNSLTSTQKMIMDKYPEVANAIFKHIEYYANGLDFPKEMLNILAESEINEPLGPEGLNALKMALATKTGGYFTKPFDANYHQLIDPFTDVNLNSTQVNQWIVYFTVQCAVLRLEHPEWSTAKIYWYASKEMLHIALDIVGLVPVVGEIADLANGAIYTIHGDGLNATLSVASAIPVAGWFAVGIKYAKKTVNIVGGGKTTLKWLVKSGNNIVFGDRGQLRKVLNLAIGDPRQAHHIIPWGKSIHPAIQKAAKSSNEFHMNEAFNGIPLNTAVHSGSHLPYDNRVTAKLNLIPANASPEETYNAVLSIINNIKAAMLTHPNTHINNIIF